MADRFVAVVGTINHDVVIGRHGESFESLGGILYNVIPLAILLEGTPFRVRAVGRLGREHREQALELLSRFPNARGEFLIADPRGTNESRLDYSAPGERVESAEMRVAPLSIADLHAVAGAEAVLVNMISGRDVGRVALSRVLPGAGFPCLDVQALARTSRGERRSRLVPQGAAWARLFDLVRGNEEEIAHLGGTPGEPRRAAHRLLAAGTSEVLVTSGESGAWRLARGARGLEQHTIPAVPCPDPRDPTGCGDSFLAAVVAGRMLGLSGQRAAELGAAVASHVASLSGLASLDGLRDVLPELRSEFLQDRGRNLR